MSLCLACRQNFPKSKALSSHLSQRPECRATLRHILRSRRTFRPNATTTSTSLQPSPSLADNESPHSPPPKCYYSVTIEDVEDEGDLPRGHTSPSQAGASPAPARMPTHSATGSPRCPPPKSTQSPRHPPPKRFHSVTVEDVEDEGDLSRSYTSPSPPSQLGASPAPTRMPTHGTTGSPRRPPPKPTQSPRRPPPKRFHSVMVEDVEDEGDPPRGGRHEPVKPSLGSAPSQACATIGTEKEGEDPHRGEAQGKTRLFPSSQEAGKVFGKGSTSFERRYKKQTEAGEKPWAPFASAAEAEYANWLVSSGMSQKEIDNHLKLAIVRCLFTVHAIAH
ncbi:hypothetical protein BOTBODRAFT_176838 [Botryobasidium botryosum FD-172 SS1]|uniref:Uncharacterized protein n=1 Tax=Botryobasidium botryosum (strain FD-172 SS1) TaxID=930990 RepID=A0A067MJL8_BOTB1|nr:hypothetical protein BOTBODRAFT_176838 [Botryobasidium botryosum FD-172 SS1]